MRVSIRKLSQQTKRSIH